MEWVFIFLPLLYHGLYGIYIWYEGRFQCQRISLERQLALHFAALDRHHRLHLYRVSRVRHAVHRRAPDGGSYQYAFWKVWYDFQSPWTIAVLRHRHCRRLLALLLRCLAVCSQVGFYVGDNARRKFGFVCAGLAVMLIGDWDLDDYAASSKRLPVRFPC